MTKLPNFIQVARLPIRIIDHSLSLSQHPFVTEFNERVVRIQMKDQIDIMKRKKISPSEQYSSGEGEGDSLDPPTIKKPGGK